PPLRRTGICAYAPRMIGKAQLASGLREQCLQLRSKGGRFDPVTMQGPRRRAKFGARHARNDRETCVTRLIAKSTAYWLPRIARSRTAPVLAGRFRLLYRAEGNADRGQRETLPCVRRPRIQGRYDVLER